VRTQTNAAAMVWTSWSESASAISADSEARSASATTRSHAGPEVGRLISWYRSIQIPRDASPPGAGTGGAPSTDTGLTVRMLEKRASTHFVPSTANDIMRKS